MNEFKLIEAKVEDLISAEKMGASISSISYELIGLKNQTAELKAEFDRLRDLFIEYGVPEENEK